MAIAPSPEFLQLQPAVAGRYSLERELGRGGMGVVFLARDVALDRPVAVKLLPATLAGQPDLRERFLREARTAAKLSHPNVVPIHVVEEHGDVVFFVMTFVDGETLGQRVRRAGPLTASQATRMMQEVAWALAYAHGRGVVHRDIKPDNILLDKDTGRAMVTDFGIARVAEHVTLSGAGELVGTANYMSPEQASGEDVDGRSDLFSLGVTTFFALAGKLPFEGPNLPAVVVRIVNQKEPRLAELRSDLPVGLSEAVHRCLAKQRSERFATGEELAEAVGTAIVASDAAPQVRLLMRNFRELDHALALLVIGGVTLPVVWRELAARDGHSFAAGMTVMFVFPILAYTTQLFVGARHVIRAGLGPADVKRAFERVARAMREEAAVGLGWSSSSDAIAARRRWWMRLGHAGLLGAGGLFAVALASRPLSAGSMLPPLLVLSGLLSALSYGAAFALKRQMRGTKQPSLTERGIGFAERLLGTRFVDWLFQVAGTGLDIRRQNESPATERTEVLLAAAAGDVFDRLPRGLKVRFAMVPKLIKKLEADAVILRNREDELRRLTLGGGNATVAESARARIGERLASAVAAIESIRLDLLRLHAGTGSPDELTADLERARAIGTAIDAELQAQLEVAHLLATPT